MSSIDVVVGRKTGRGPRTATNSIKLRNNFLEATDYLALEAVLIHVGGPMKIWKEILTPTLKEKPKKKRNRREKTTTARS